MDYKKQIMNFFEENFMVEFNGQFDHDASLLENGIIDSTGVLEIVTFIEETFSIQVEDEEIVTENFDSINNLNMYLASKVSVNLED